MDTATLSIGTGAYGSNEYKNLNAFVSSAPLGLTNSEVTTPLNVEIGAPTLGGAFAGATVLLESGSTLNGLYLNSAIGSWNDVSPIGPLNFAATANGPLSLTLSNSDTLSITNFENAPPFGQATFQATLAPEASSLVLLALAVTGLASLAVACRLRKTA